MRIQFSHPGKERGLVRGTVKIRELFLGRLSELPCLDLSPEKTDLIQECQGFPLLPVKVANSKNHYTELADDYEQRG